MIASSIKGFITWSLLACISRLSFAQQSIMLTGNSITAGSDRPVLLHIGTNDLNGAISLGTDTAQEIDAWATLTTARVDSIIGQIFASHSNPASLRVLLTNFIPYQGPFTNPVADRCSSAGISCL